MPAKRETNPFATSGATWPEPPSVRIHTFAPVSLVEPVPAPPPAKPCPITLTLEVQSPAEDLEPLSPEVFPPELCPPASASVSPERLRQPEPVAADPRPTPTVSTGEVLEADPCSAEFILFPADPRRQATVLPMRDVESMMFDEMMRRAQSRPKARSSWVLLAAGAGMGAGATAVLSMLTLPMLIGALRGPAAPSPPPQVGAAAAAQPSTVILSGFIPAASSTAAAAADTRSAATARGERARGVYRDPPPGSLPVVEEWGRGRPLPPELAQAVMAPSQASPSPAGEPRDRQSAKDSEPAAARR